MEFGLGVVTGIVILFAIAAWKARSQRPILQVTATPKAAENLHWLLKISGYRDMTEVGQVAFGLLDLAWHEYGRGGKLLIRDQDGTEREISLKPTEKE